MSEDSDVGPGWAAIDAALERLYPGQQPRHFANPAARFKGDQLVGVSAYRRQEPVPHWHYITYGLTELYEKEFRNPELSGFGFELTMRIVSDDDVDPPMWPLNVLTMMANYVARSGNRLGDGEWMGELGPITNVVQTSLTAAAFAYDPELPAIATVHGEVSFLQIVPLTTDEINAVTSWNAGGLLAAMLPAMPLWATDPTRGSHLHDPVIADVVAQGMTRDGSTTGLMFLTTLDWTAASGGLHPRAPAQAQFTVTMTAAKVRAIVELLGSRLLFDREVALASQEYTVRCLPGPTPGAVVTDERTLEITIPPEACRALAATLVTEPGEYEIQGIPQVRFRLV